MNPSPLLLDRYVVTEFSFKAHADYNYPPENDTGGKVGLADLKVEVVPHQHKDDSSRWIFNLLIELPEIAEPKYPYSFKVELVGFFNVSPKYPSDRADVLVRANAPAVLYSAAREFVASTTGRGPFMAVWLPAVTFIEPLASVAATPREIPRKTKLPAPPKAKKKKRSAVAD